MDSLTIIIIVLLAILVVITIVVIIIVFVPIHSVPSPYSQILTQFESPENQVKQIIFYCGRSPMFFWPGHDKLGGSETAVVQLAKNFKYLNKNLDVRVYGTVKSGNYDGVKYYSYNDFNNIKTKVDVLILWRLSGSRILPSIDKSMFGTIVLDLHDADPYYVFPQEISKVDLFMMKSQYQKEYYKQFQPSIVCVNGVTDIDKYLDNRKVPKNPKEFFYTSCYLRGLEGILMYSWPVIISKIPDAKLHLYYGMNMVHPDRKQNLRSLIDKYPGSVIDHGRVSREELRNEISSKLIHFYPSTAFFEIDCISVRESALSGSIPIIPNAFAFEERAGLHFDFDQIGSKQFFESAAFKAIELLSKTPKEIGDYLLNDVDNVLRATLKSWEIVATDWLNILNNQKRIKV